MSLSDRATLGHKQYLQTNILHSNSFLQTTNVLRPNIIKQINIKVDGQFGNSSRILRNEDELCKDKNVMGMR